MSGYDDYRDEMSRTALSDQEIERFFSGEANNGLAALAPIVEMLRDYETAPSEAAVEQFAAEASRLAADSRLARGPVAATRRGRAIRMRPQLAGAALAVVLVAGGAGVAAAADAAVPGDGLYGLDRTLERIGIWDGRTEERLDEASHLVADGRLNLALTHATEALDEDGESSELALASLEDALDVLPGPEDPENSPGTTEKVGALLSYIQENVGKGVGADGREFGQGVAELARGLTVEETDDPVPDITVPPTTTSAGDSGDGSEDDGPGHGTGNQGTNPGQGNGNGNQGTNPGQVDENGNQGTNPGQGNGDQGTNPGQGNGNGNQGTNPGQGNGSGSSPGDSDPGPPETEGGAGNGPPPSSPSETAPGRANKP